MLYLEETNLMKQEPELSGMDNAMDSQSRAAADLQLSVELELATEQTLETAPLRQEA